MNPETAGRDQNKNSILEWLKTILIAVIIAIPIRFFIAEPFIVSGASMDPTFASGQFLIVDRLSYNLGIPDRGDVVIFKYPENPKVYYIKRVIGLPGETISIKDGKVTIINDQNPDGFVLEENYLSPLHRSYDTESITLERDQYFVLGDNRAQSSDSRIWGPLGEKYIVGRPFIRLFPFNSVSLWPGEIRWDENN